MAGNDPNTTTTLHNSKATINLPQVPQMGMVPHQVPHQMGTADLRVYLHSSTKTPTITATIVQLPLSKTAARDMPVPVVHHPPLPRVLVKILG